MDLDENEEDLIRMMQRWTRKEETLLCECWVEVSENNEIEADRSDDSFCWQIIDDFNKATHHGDRANNMIKSKWTRVNGDCQKFNAIYKYLERKSEENEHKASCKTKLVNSASKPIHTLHMDLFGPTSVSSLNHKWYCLVVTGDFTRCDNGGEFRNKEMNGFCSKKWIKREFSNVRTPQQNGVVERRNKTLIEAARTMLADAKLPVTFWAEAVNTACYVQNRVLGSLRQKGMKVVLFNKRTKRVEENLHVDFLENRLIEKGTGPNWLFDIDSLTNSTNYVLVVVAGTNSTNFLGTKKAAGQDVKKYVSCLRYIAIPNWFHEAHLESSTSNAQDACNPDAPESSENSNPTATSTNPLADHMETLAVETSIPTVSLPVPTACLDDSPQLSSDIRLISKRVIGQDDTPSLDNILTLTNRFEDILGVTINTDDSNRVEADLGNMEYNISAIPTPTFRIHMDHPKKPKKIYDALQDLSWVEAMQKELLQFKIQNVWSLVDCPNGEEGIDYDEVFAHVARIEAIRLFLAYASFLGFTVYQMDVKSAFLYGTIDEEVYVMQPLRFQDLEFPAIMYKVEKAMYGFHQAPRAWYVYQMDVKSAFLYGTIDEEVYVMQPLRFQDPEFPAIMYKVEKAMYGFHQAPRAFQDPEFPAIMYKVEKAMYGFHQAPRAWRQVTPKECHLHAVKRMFRYLKDHPKLGLWEVPVLSCEYWNA
nr:hypothetical protein [Tanacetum cinerariifolium]